MARKIIGKIHLWLGLLSGLVVFIVALTGAIYCFAPEINDATQSYRFVRDNRTEFLSPSRLKEIAESELPGKKANRIYYGGPDRSAYVMFFGTGMTYYINVFIDPYTGQVLKVKNMKRDFMNVILYLHFTLLIPYGKEIVGWSTFIFFIMMISGLFLWWPRNRAAKKQRFAIKWNASPKRLNYDFHNVLGFYATSIAIIIAFTGLIWAFDWFANGVYKLTGGDQSVIAKKPPVSDTTEVRSTIAPVDKIWGSICRQQQGYLVTEIILPGTKTAPFLVRANPASGTYYKTDYWYFDQYTGNEIPGSYVFGKRKDAHKIADKIRRMNFDIHTGAILGLPGRLLTFLASLIIASLPLTGLRIWLGRKKVN